MTSARNRIALYSHDTVGLGHTRRSLALADAITSADPWADVLMITGNPEAALLPRPERTDIITLPTIAKGRSGEYRPRVLGSDLGDVLHLRQHVISGALSSFLPQLLVVDKVAGGVEGELIPALRDLRRRGGTRIVLGLREILDAPAVVRREWDIAGTAELIKDFYDAVWVYGDPAVIDPVTEYGWNTAIAAKVTHTGYLGRPSSRSTSGPRSSTAPMRQTATGISVPPPVGPYVLCQVGGGQDGYRLAEAFARTELPAGHQGVILTGPYLAADRRDQLRRLAGSTTRVIDFVGNADQFVTEAAAVVSMAGYNSVCELMGTAVPALLVPRVTPRTEQLIRAERLADLDCADLLHPDLLSPDRLSDWMADAVTGPAPAGRSRLDLTGLDRVGRLARTMIGGDRVVA